MANLYRARKRGNGGIQVDSLVITTMPTKTTYSVGDALDLTGLVVTASAGSLSGTVTNECTFSPADGSILSEEGTITINVSYLGTTTSFNVTCSEATSWLESSTWAEIDAAIKNGTFAQHASVGDTKSFIVNGKTYNAEVVSINDGTGNAGSWYPANTVDFISKETYEGFYSFNDPSSSVGGFPASDLRETLVNTIYPLLPSDLKEVIIEKSHSYNINESGTMTSDSTKLWLPTYYELTGIINSEAPGETVYNNKKYTLASLLKLQNYTSIPEPMGWWTGTIASYEDSDSRALWSVDFDGIMSNNEYSASTLAVPICFRIGASPSTIPEWSTATDQQITDTINAYYNGDLSLSDIQEVWKIGQKRNMTIDSIATSGTYNNNTWSVGESHRSQTVEVEILDFNCDTLVTQINGKGKALMTVDIKDCLADAAATSVHNNTEEGYMNSNATNSGGWENTDRRKWCNGGFYQALPTYMKNLVKLVYKDSAVGNNNVERVRDYIFLPSEYEVFGNYNYSVIGEGSHRYAWFVNTNGKKGPAVHSDYSDWWLRSLFYGDSRSFRFVPDYGSAVGEIANVAYGLAPAWAL